MTQTEKCMDIELNDIEIRVLGCLIEKEAATPDNYPLSINAVLTAANQKTNRFPVLQLSEGEVQNAVDSLARHTLVGSRSGAGSRVLKYAHRLSDRLGDEFRFSQRELGVQAVLFLRGPQTAGEIKTRGARIHHLKDVSDVISTLQSLANRETGACVTRLAPAPGQKEARYAHLWSGEVDDSVLSQGVGPSAGQVSVDVVGRVSALEETVSELRAQLDTMQEKLRDLL